MRGMVFGHDYQTAVEKLEEIIDKYTLFCYAKLIEKRILKNEATAIFDNGDIWQAVGNCPSKRIGRRCNIAYIDLALSKEAQEDIRCCVITPPFTGIQYYGIPID